MIEPKPLLDLLMTVRPVEVVRLLKRAPSWTILMRTLVRHHPLDAMGTVPQVFWASKPNYSCVKVVQMGLLSQTVFVSTEIVLSWEIRLSVAMPNALQAPGSSLYLVSAKIPKFALKSANSEASNPQNWTEVVMWLPKKEIIRVFALSSCFSVSGCSLDTNHEVEVR